MWIESLRQFLNRSLQRFEGWLRGLEQLPTRLFHQGSIGRSSPLRGGSGAGNIRYILDPQTGRWSADLCYQYRSLTCQLRVSQLEPPPGMQHIYTALQSTDEG